MNRIILLFIITAVGILRVHSAVIPHSVATDISDTETGYGNVAHEYKPMIEIGKEWKYLIKYIRRYNNDVDVLPADFTRILRIDSKTEIDGLEYYVMNAYSNNSDQPDSTVPVGYFREDCSEGKVWFRSEREYSSAPLRHTYVHRFSDETLLYDFINPSDGMVLEVSDLSDIDEPIHFAALDCDRFGYCTREKGAMMVEGIGLLPYAAAAEYIESIFWGDIFGVIPEPTGEVDGYVPLLYEVTDKEGKPIVRIIGNTPGQAGINHIPTDADMGMRLVDNMLYLIPNDTPGNVSVFDIFGRFVMATDVSQSAVIDFRTLQPGVYIVRHSDKSYKIVIR